MLAARVRQQGDKETADELRNEIFVFVVATSSINDEHMCGPLYSGNITEETTDHIPSTAIYIRDLVL